MVPSPLQAIKPTLQPGNQVSPNHDTMGERLNRLSFHDLYARIEEKGLRHFPRLNKEGDVELYVVYENVEDFDEQVEADVYVEFTRYKSKWIAVLWTVTDPGDPLGLPVSFAVKEEEPRYLAIRFLEQPQIWIHYLALADDQLIHVYSEAISFFTEEKGEAEQLLLDAYDHEDATEEEGGIPQESFEADAISDVGFLEKGLSFYLDYGVMENRLGEEGAREQAMGALYRAIWMMSRHPNPQARESEFMIWVREETGENREGERTRLLVMTMTPTLRYFLHVVNRSEEDENPLASVLMAVTEFQKTEEEAPLAHGALPIIRYAKGTLQHIEWEEVSLTRLKRLFVMTYPDATFNPYEG